MVAEPTHEYNYGDVFSFSRNSIACQLPHHRGFASDGEATQVAANILRTETVSAISLETAALVGPTDTIWMPWVSVGNDILVTLSTGGSNTKIYRISNATTSATWAAEIASGLVIDLDANNGVGETFEGKSINITCLTVLDDDSWLICTSDDAGAGNPPNDGYIWRSTDSGATWTLVHTMVKGYVFYSGFECGVNGQHIVVGSYTAAKDCQDGPRQVYYSNDYGVTWDTIYDPGQLDGVPAGGLGRHCHSCCFLDDGNYDTVYISYGDGAYKKVVKVVKPVGWTFGDSDWDVDVAIVTRQQPTCLKSVGSVVYMGFDGAARGYGLISIIDSADDLVKRKWNIPFPVNDNSHPYKIYKSGADDVYVYQILYHEGILYAGVRQESNDATGIRRNGGIYASANGKDWSCVYRKQGAGSEYLGCYRLACVAGGKLWYQGSSAAQDTIYSVPLPEIKEVSAMRIEKGVTNTCEDASDAGNNSYFPSGVGQWSGTNGAVLSRDTSKYLSNNASIKSVPTFGTYPWRVWQGYTWASRLDVLRDAIDADSLVCFTIWVKGTSIYPEQAVNVLAYTDGAKCDTVDGEFIPSGDWQKITSWGRYVVDGPSVENSSYRIHFYDAFAGGAGTDASPSPIDTADWNDMTLNWDCAQDVLIDPSGGALQHRHASSCTFQYGGTARVNEVATFAMTGSDFTISFSWVPDCASREWDLNTDADILLAHIEDPEGNYIDIYYDASTGTFIATDGVNTAETSAVSWEFFDQVNIALACDFGTDFTLSVETPKDGKVSDTSAGSAIGAIASLTIGTNNDGTDFGCGLFFNVRGWNSELNSDDIAEVFDETGLLKTEIKPAVSQLGGLLE